MTGSFLFWERAGFDVLLIKKFVASNFYTRSKRNHPVNLVYNVKGLKHDIKHD